MLSQILYPSNLREILRSYLFDIDRPWKDKEYLERFRDKMFRKIFNYSKRVPLYNKKYRDVKSVDGIEDIKKLPIVDKLSIKRGFPYEIIDDPSRKDMVLMSTSGSTGKPLRIYRSISSLMRGWIISLRMFRAHGIDYKKDRIMVIGDFNVESSYDKRFLDITSKIGLFKIFRNIIFVPFDTNVDEMLKLFRDFKPTALSGYPILLSEITRKAIKSNINTSNVKFLASSGYVLDKYTRGFLEDTYGTMVVDVYGSIEIDTAMFQCREGLYHINSDLIHLEFLDREGHPVSPNEVGRIIATRLYGKDTPILRYSGLDDLAVPTDEECGCGINTATVKHVEGRKVDAIVLPGGKIISPFIATTLIMDAMRNRRSYCLRQFQIVQSSLENISVRLVFEEDKCDNRDVIVKEMQRVFSKEFGLDVEVKVVDKIDNFGRDLPPPVVSKVWKNVNRRQ